MPSPEQLEFARLLLRRASSDLRACRVLGANPDMDDDVVGFHAQQAVEKALKAVLVLHGAHFRATHDLDFLQARVVEGGVAPPPGLERVDWLTPWAAQLRYDEAHEHLDRTRAVEAAESAVEWAQRLVE